MSVADIGLIGLAVMGENLILNMAEKGFTVACFNRTVSKVDSFIAGRAKGKTIIGCHSIEELIATLSKPRKVMLMIKAGAPVDEYIEKILPNLGQGDIIIDGGNSHFADTNRRCKYIESKGKLFIGTGISGGEEGALKGPSIMPGGSPNAWEQVKPILQKIAAKTDDGKPCCEWVGENGAGHFVKMVHNAIEYGNMQLICEAYHLMKQSLGLTNQQMSDCFAQWSRGQLNSYLLEITRDILKFKDPQGNETIDLILDSAGQKGTGKWTVIEGLNLGQPLTLAGEAVFGRYLSAMKTRRAEAAKILKGPQAALNGDKEKMLEDLSKALYAGQIVSYAQGFELMQAASTQYGWRLDCAGIAQIWQAGCIIRAAILTRIKQAFDSEPALMNLLLAPFFAEAMGETQLPLRRIVASAVKAGIPIPVLGCALSFYDGYRCDRLPANLLQAQRDYFGSHTYQRIDKPASALPCFHEFDPPRLWECRFRRGYKIRGSTRVRADCKVHLLQQRPKLDHHHVLGRHLMPNQLRGYKLQPTSHPVLKG